LLNFSSEGSAIFLEIAVVTAIWEHCPRMQS
jgi:hypothetical protein